MAKFTGYADIVTPQHVLYKMYAAGIKKTPPGHPLGDLLKETGGVYEIDLVVPEDMRNKLRLVAELSSDSELQAIADRGTSPVSLEHLRGVDPQTLIVYGHYLAFTKEENEQLDLGSGQAPDLDPKNTMYWDRSEE
jgi:hypothetical protein